MNKILYTFQRPGHALTKKHPPLIDYTEPGRPYFEIGRFLEWEQWVWFFPEMKYFYNNEWITDPQGKTLWVLSVPPQEIRWLGLNIYCENSRPVSEMFYSDPEYCLEIGDIPQVLVKSPLNPHWIIQTHPEYLVY